MAAARKRYGDLNVANGPLRLDQQLYVTANVNADLTEIAAANSSDLIIISGPESSAIPANNVGLPTVSLSETELLEFSLFQAPCDTAIYYDKGPLLHPHVGKVLCAVVLGFERESSTALRLCARMRPKVEVEVLHIVAPGIGDNLGLLNNMIAICTQKSMSYRVVINSNPMAALFEELNSNYPDPLQDGEGARELPEDYYINPNNPYSNNRDKRPYSMIVVGALPPHLSQFLISNTTCAVLMVYPKSKPPSDDTPPNSPVASPSHDDVIMQPLSPQESSVSLMSLVTGASAPQVIHPEFPARGSPHVSVSSPQVVSPGPPSSTSPPVRGTSSSAIVTSPLAVLSPPLTTSPATLSEASAFAQEWPSPSAKSTSTAPSHVIANECVSDGDDDVDEEFDGIALLPRSSAHQSTHQQSLTSSTDSPMLNPFRGNSSQPSSAQSSPKLSSRSRTVTSSDQPNVIVPTKQILPNHTLPLSNSNFPEHTLPNHSLPPNHFLSHNHILPGHVVPGTPPNHTSQLPPNGVPKSEIPHLRKEELGPANVGLDPDYSPANPFLDPVSPFGTPDQPTRPLLSQFSSPIPTTPPNKHLLPNANISHTIFPTPQATHQPTISTSLPPTNLIPTTPLALQQQQIENSLKLSNPFAGAGDVGMPVIYPGSAPADLSHYDFTVPVNKTPAQILCELPLHVWGQVCMHLNLAEVAALTRVCPAIQRLMTHNTLWCAIATACWPEAQSNATVGINWKQLCLLYHSKTFPHLVLRDYTGTSRGRYHLVSCMFIGDDSEMGGAESVFFLNKISKGAAISRATTKANVMTLEYAPYFFITVSLSQLSKVQVPYDRTSAIVVPILTRSSHNTNIDTVLPKRYITELNTVLQEAGPTSPLVVFFHFNTVPNTNSNSSDSTFVQKLVAVFHGLILKSPHPFRKLLVQPFNFRSGSGFSDGLWWMVSNIPQPPSLLREEVLLSVTHL